MGQAPAGRARVQGVTVPPNFAIAQPVQAKDHFEVIDKARKFSVAPMMECDGRGRNALNLWALDE
jgi:hypothetical protein